MTETRFTERTTLQNGHRVRTVSCEVPSSALAPVVDVSGCCEIAKVLGTSCSSDCQVQGERDLANYFRPLPDGYWAVPPLGRGMNAYPKIPRAWWPRIAEEYGAGMSGPKLAKKYGVRSTRTIYLILEKYRQEQAHT